MVVVVARLHMWMPGCQSCTILYLSETSWRQVNEAADAMNKEMKESGRGPSTSREGGPDLCPALQCRALSQPVVRVNFQ